jgi:ferritin-like metal-binding protein YciE
MPSSFMNEKLVQYFNEALAMENAAVDRSESRIKETPVEQTRQQLQYHLEQTFQQQDRLKKIITDLGGSPTTMKASLPKLMPMNMDTITNTVKQAAKSITSPENKEMMDVEKELVQTKEDAIIENAEIVSYKMLMEMAEKAGMKDAMPMLKQSLQEETAMVNFIMGNAPLLLGLVWPKLEAPEKEGGGKKEKEMTRAA